MKDARSYGKKCGVSIKATYLTTGDHDLVAILEAENGDNVAKFALGVGTYGNVRTKTVRGVDRGRAGKIHRRAAATAK